ncbi:hypothetical protein [Andreprevotia sp. IGB-42]|uniref:hypothetical protein n=1 Tax=Andreprevotia sp. IGB-42 TaxID=2497473 RepID=UPI00135BB263|nr:hypothetical protein [Andreprevotia sp. IGB-42]
MPRWLARLVLLALVLPCMPAAHAETDPMRMPAAAAPASSASSAAMQRAPLVLTLIRLRGTQRTAWINDRPLIVGDRMEGATVTAIDLAGVTLQRDGQREYLAITPPVKIKRAAAAASKPTRARPTITGEPAP